CGRRQRAPPGRFGRGAHHAARAAGRGAVTGLTLRLPFAPSVEAPTFLGMVGLTGASEDYLKAIYHIAHRGEAVTTGLLAAELGVARGDRHDQAVAGGRAGRPRGPSRAAAHRVGRGRRAARRTAPPTVGDVPQPDARRAVARGALRGRALGARAFRAARGTHR